MRVAMSERGRTSAAAAASLAVALSMGATACVLPNDAVTGAEVSWYVLELAEQSPNEGETESGTGGDSSEGDPPLARTCMGGLITRIELELTDDDDPDRHRRFQYECGFGQQSPEDNLTSPSEIFIELKPGRYRAHWTAIDDPQDRDATGNPRMVVDEVVDLRVDKGLETLTWAIVPPPGTLELDLQGVEDCDTVAARLLYAAPAEDLFDHAGDAEDPEPVPYREGVESDQGLRLDGTDHACDELTGGAHRFEALDRGRYELEVVRNEGDACTVPLMFDETDGSPTVLTLDLSDQPC